MVVADAVEHHMTWRSTCTLGWRTYVPALINLAIHGHMQVDNWNSTACCVWGQHMLSDLSYQQGESWEQIDCEWGNLISAQHTCLSCQSKIQHFVQAPFSTASVKRNVKPTSSAVNDQNVTGTISTRGTRCRRLQLTQLRDQRKQRTIRRARIQLKIHLCAHTELGIQG